MKIFRFKDRVEFEEVIPSKCNKWGNDAILFRVNKGIAKLATKYGEDSKGKTYIKYWFGKRKIADEYLNNR